MIRRGINELIARKSVIIFGTMWVFYGFFIYGLLPLIPSFRPYQSQLFYWSGWVQLWALPLIMVGQNVMGQVAERRDQETHDTVMKQFEAIKETIIMQKEDARLEKEQVQRLNLLLEELHCILPNMPELHKTNSFEPGGEENAIIRRSEENG